MTKKQSATMADVAERIEPVKELLEQTYRRGYLDCLRNVISQLEKQATTPAERRRLTRWYCAVDLWRYGSPHFAEIVPPPPFPRD